MSFCLDNRFEMIDRVRTYLEANTKIKDNPAEMDVIDNILYRFWMLGWLQDIDSKINKRNEQGLCTDYAQRFHCIDYIQANRVFNDDGSINIRQAMIENEHSALKILSDIVSWGGKIVDVYIGNSIDGKFAEWKPDGLDKIVSDNDWFSEEMITSSKNVHHGH